MGKVKVIGYAQRQFFDNGIEYRNFSDNLVGQQLTSDGGTSLFTTSTFVVSTNLDPKLSKTFKTNKFGNFQTLETLNLTQEQLTLLDETTKIKLNLDKSDITKYAYFGSLREFIRVSLEKIITYWPSSIYVTPIDGLGTGYTIEDYIYDSINNKSTFKTSVNRLDNKYDVKFLQNAESINNYAEEEDDRNLTVNYLDYVISGTAGQFNILGYTGATNEKNDYIYFEVSGHPFSGGGTDQSGYYHIKPNQDKVNSFFATLNDFEKYILNRQTIPLYTSRFTFSLKTDKGVVIETEKEITWPTDDGYNLDFNTSKYVTFANDLLTLADDSDSIQTNIIARFLVSNSISDFDTVPKGENAPEDDTGQKIDKTLKIYGREFDEIKRFTDGIALANVVTYNKKDNTPDALLKTLARTLGWGLTSSLEENDFITSYLTPANSTYSGQSLGLTPEEAEKELWRRIILNTPWIWKSKGSRKAIEFFLKFIGVPNGLVRFNEHLYVAKKSLDMDEFLDVLGINSGDRDISNIPINSDGFPKILPDNPNMYFQKGGLWYRETGGANSDIDILGGNNPHIGPYDGGQEYINQFNCLIPSFSSVTLIEETITTGETQLFNNYNYGVVNNILDTKAIAQCTVDLDWGTILSSQTESCYSTNIDWVGVIDNCTFSVDWSITITIDDVVEYTGPSFYTSTGRTDTPSQSDYINALQLGATALDLTLTTDGSTASFETPAGECEATLADKTFQVGLLMDIDIDCQPS
jgi:hypothetical protein